MTRRELQYAQTNLDERDRMTRRGDYTFEQGQLLADELMRCDNHQNGGACKHIQYLVLKRTFFVAEELTTSGLADV